MRTSYSGTFGAEHREKLVSALLLDDGLLVRGKKSYT